MASRMLSSKDLTDRLGCGTTLMTFADAVSECGLIAILRGIATGEVEAVGQVLFDAGIRVAEIPLNSPDPFTSIQKMSKAFKANSSWVQEMFSVPRM